MDMWQTVAIVVALIVLLSMLCSCCRMCVRQQEIQQRNEILRRHRQHNVLVAVIPSGGEGESTPPYGSGSWYPMSAPPPYSQHAQDRLYAASPTPAAAREPIASFPEPPTAPASLSEVQQTPAAPAAPAAGVSHDPHLLASRLQTASPPPRYEDSPPPYI